MKTIVRRSKQCGGLGGRRGKWSLIYGTQTNNMVIRITMLFALFTSRRIMCSERFHLFCKFTFLLKKQMQGKSSWLFFFSFAMTSGMLRIHEISLISCTNSRKSLIPEHLADPATRWFQLSGILCWIKSLKVISVWLLLFSWIFSSIILMVHFHLYIFHL